MTIQKITAVTSLNKGKNLQKSRINNTQNVSTTNETSLKGNEAIKNNFMSGISFKGFSKEEHSSRPHYYVGTSGSLMTVSSCDVKHPEYTGVIRGNKGYNRQTTTEVDYSVYYADPGEKITDEIKDNNSFIVVYDKKPRNVTREEIDDADKASDLLSLVDTLKITVGVLEAEDEAAIRQLDEAEEEFEDIKRRYEQAKTKKEQKAENKSNIEIELVENRDKLDIAQTKYKTVKAREEAEYRAAERRRKLNEIQDQIATVNNDAEEQIKQIEAEKDAKLAELERQKKELLGEE